MQTTSEVINYLDGRSYDYDGVPSQKYQCVDPVKYYLDKKYGIRNFSFTTSNNPHGYAKGLWENFNEYPQLKGLFVKVKNTPDFVPQKGDIVEWKGESPCGVAGHTAIATGINIGTYRFQSLDQNWGGKLYCTKIIHSYKSVYGVIRPLQKVTTTALNVRSGPGTQYKYLYEKPKGSLVLPTEYKNGWAKIGKDEWVAGNYLD